ncbi:MAG: TetR/AcrR family transcriptional regulator [Clostridiales bacterium]|nr:TetR/AcrR family transcriptional regulator [Clostridiales bacterium]
MGVSPKLKWLASGGKNPLDESPALYEAALTAFSEHSFRDASLNDILKAAGMNKGSFYYRFRDKMELYLSLLYRVGMEKIRLFEEHDVSGTSGGFFDEFRNMALLGLLLAKKDARYVVFSRRILQEDPIVREQITACFGDMRSGLLTDMVERAKAAGEFRQDLSTGTTVFVVETLLNHLDTLIPLDWDDASILCAVDQLLDVVRSGVAAK